MAKGVAGINTIDGRKSRYSNAWSEDAAALVEKEWKAGTPASQISMLLWEQLGVRKTRNSVISKVHRSGLHETAPHTVNIVKGINKVRAPVVVKAPKSDRPRNKVVVNKVSTMRKIDTGFRRTPASYQQEPSPIPDVIDNTDCAIPFIDATKQHCKWPASDDVANMMVCGRYVTTGSYCVQHSRIAYLPAKKRGRQDSSYPARYGQPPY